MCLHRRAASAAADAALPRRTPSLEATPSAWVGARLLAAPSLQTAFPAMTTPALVAAVDTPGPLPAATSGMGRMASCLHSTLDCHGPAPASSRRLCPHRTRDAFDNQMLAGSALTDRDRLPRVGVMQLGVGGRHAVALRPPCALQADAWCSSAAPRTDAAN